MDGGKKAAMQNNQCYWYEYQKCYVKWGNCKSNMFLTINGVRQGGILSPKLFVFYLNKLSLYLKNLYVGCYIDDICVNHFFYADDMCILAPSPLGLQILLNACYEYGFAHDILFHPVKSKCLVFTPKQYKLSVPCVSLNERVLENSDNVTYLGVIIRSELKDDVDMKRKLRNLYVSANSILYKFASCSSHVKCQLIESYSLHLYCSYLWCRFNRDSLSKLRVAYNNIYRKILGYNRRDSASNMFVTHRIDNFEARLRKVCYGFIQRLNVSENAIIMRLRRNQIVTNTYLHQCWNTILH